MATIADLLIKIGADSSGLSQELTKSKDAINSTFSTNPVKEFSSGIDDATGKLNSLVGSFTKIAGLAAGGFGLNAIVQSAVNAGEAVYELGQKYQMSAAQAGEFKRIMALTDGDVDTAAKAIMRLDSTLQSTGASGDKARAMLSVFGVSMTDASGGLKPLNEQLEALAKGYQNARDAGMGQEFVMNTLGVRGAALTKTLLEYSEAKERASHIQSVGLNPEQMHQAYLDMKEVNMQFSQLGIVAGSALAPIVSEILPGVESGLAGVAKWIRTNKDLVSGTIVEVTKLIALYEGLKAARNTVNGAVSIYHRVSDAVSTATGTGASATGFAHDSQLTQQQERQIRKTQADAEKMYAARRREAIKTAQQENLSAQEMQAFLSEKFAQIEAEAVTTSETIRASMTAAFQQANMAANEAAVGMTESTAALKASSAEVCEAELATGAAATESAAVKKGADADKIASSADVAAANAKVSESELATGAAAVEGTTAKAEANAAKIASTAEVIAANEQEKLAEIATGVEAQNTGKKSVAANTATKNGLTAVETKTKDVAKGHALAGKEALKAGASTVKVAGQGFGAIGKVTSALFTMAGGWGSVAAAALYAAYCAFKYFNAKYEASVSNTWTGDDGYTYVNRDGQYYRVRPANESPVNDPMGLGDVGNGGATEELIDPSNPLYQKLYTHFSNVKGSETYNFIQQLKAEEERKKAEDLANKVNDSYPTFDFNDVGGGGGGGSDGGGSTGGYSSEAAPVAEPAKPVTPTWTKYSFYDDPELAQWANQIQYAAETHGIDPRLLAAVVKTESHGQADAWSSDYAHYGLGQISQYIANRCNDGAGYGDGSDPNQNLLAAAAYLSELYQTYGDVSQTISAYNAGYPTSGNSSYVNTVMGYMDAMTATQVTGTAPVQQPVAYDVPVGEYVAQVALSDYKLGDDWRGRLGNDTDGWCDDWVHDVYARVSAALGKEDPFPLNDVVNDKIFRAKGAYHSGDLEAIRGVLQPGDMVDTPKHVGIYLGNGMVRSRQTDAGINDLSLEDFNSTFEGGIVGYGSVAEAFGNLQVPSTLVGKTAFNKAAAEAARKQAEARQQYAELVNTLEAALQKDTGTQYEQSISKLAADLANKYTKISAINNVGTVDTSKAVALMGEYQEEQLKKIEQQRQANLTKLEQDTKLTLAKIKDDYAALDDANLSKTLDTLAKERLARYKSVSRHKSDLEAMKAVEDWYNVQVQAANKEREEKRRQEFGQSVQAAIKQLDMLRLKELTESQALKADVEWEERGKAATTYYKLVRDSSISVYGIANDAAGALYSGLSNIFSSLGDNIENVGKIAQNVGKVILNTIVQIAAKWAAAKITMGLLGGFMGVGDSMGAGQFGSTWTYSDPYSALTYSNDFGAKYDWWSGVKFANGGVITAPTLGLLGEGQDEEGVFPLNNETYSRIANGIAAARISNTGGNNAPVVNIINNSNSQVSVKDAHYDQSMRRWILNAVVEDVTSNVDGAATNLKAALGVR